jgi:hypothetical protein
MRAPPACPATSQYVRASVDGVSRPTPQNSIAASAPPPVTAIACSTPSA